MEAACYPVLDAVVESITNEYGKLEERIKNWENIAKTSEMLAEQQAILAARSKSANVKEKFAAGVEFALTMKKKKLSLSNIVEGVLAINELNRLRQIELNQELAPPAKSQGDPQEYLKQWNRVILSEPSEQIDGAMMPVSYWYEDFMPKLLAAFSVSTTADLNSNTVADETALQQWFERAQQAGEFDNYGADVAENFSQCTPQQKLAIKQAWKLTRHYLNGVQKRRERLEFGRDSGDLSHYIAFIDVYLSRTHVKQKDMRVSFPYYIGPGVWRFFHTTAEIMATKTPQQQTALIATFKEFFQLFATMYPCPYCRHHLNAYVLQNSEVEMYPLEYLVLGREANRSDFAIELDKKLSTVTDGASLRLFFWKLHNTVNSSISRTEEWFHKDDNAFYTTRYWPSLDSELVRAKAFNHAGITTERIYRIYGLLKPAARLAGLRSQLQRLLDKGESEAIKEVCNLGEKQIQELEKAVLKGDFLQNTYQFNPDIVDQAPYFTPEEEEFGRSGVFVEA